MKASLFVFCGGSRTFEACAESVHEHLFTLFSPRTYDVHSYFYLKLTDPGPKDSFSDHFSYKDNERGNIVNKIRDVFGDDDRVQYTIIDGDEISDDELLKQVRTRSLFTNFLASDKNLLRSLHCHFNFERCGLWILDREKSIGKKFDYIVYVRPDLFFTEDCPDVESFSKDKVTLGNSMCWNNDHLALVPRALFDQFFFDRMKIYREDVEGTYEKAEDIYWKTIQPYDVALLGPYVIKRNFD